MISVMRTRRIWFGIFLLMLGLSIAALATWGLRVGIDFAGGTLIEFGYEQAVPVDTVRTAVQTNETFKDGIVQPAGSDTVLVRTAPLTDEQVTELTTLLTSVGAGERVRVETVGPTIGRDLTRRAIWGVGLALVGILFYVAWAFRSVPRPLTSWQFGLAAVLTLAHDVLFVAGLFALLGHFLDYTVDAYFITALLTVMGFSVHDTIVVFDRIRENLRNRPNGDLTEIFDASIAQTIVRSLATSLTALIVLSSLLVLGGASIRPFVVALFTGIVVGTYSSIFVATPLLPILARVGRPRRKTR